MSNDDDFQIFVKSFMFCPLFTAPYSRFEQFEKEKLGQKETCYVQKTYMGPSTAGSGRGPAIAA